MLRRGITGCIAAPLTGALPRRSRRASVWTGHLGVEQRFPPARERGLLRAAYVMPRMIGCGLSAKL
jgi:hypothetical protein